MVAADRRRPAASSTAWGGYGILLPIARRTEPAALPALAHPANGMVGDGALASPGRTRKRASTSRRTCSTPAPTTRSCRQPFGNTLVVKTCTGQQIYDVLNQQFNNPAAGSNRIMLPSANVHYQWTTSGGPHVVDGSVSFDGGTTPVDKAASYRIAVNNFMADGGDNYTVFKSCTEPLGGEVDLDAFARYLGAHSPVAPPTLNRIELLP